MRFFGATITALLIMIFILGTLSDCTAQQHPSVFAGYPPDSNNIYLIGSDTSGPFEARGNWLDSNKVATWLGVLPAQPVGIGQWNYRNTTSPPVVDGRIHFNNATVDLATVMYIKDVRSDGVDMETLLLAIDAGTEFWLPETAVPGNYAHFKVGVPIDQVGYVEFPVVMDAFTGTPWPSNTDVTLVMTGGGGSGVAGGGMFNSFNQNDPWQVTEALIDTRTTLTMSTGANWLKFESAASASRNFAFEFDTEPLLKINTGADFTALTPGNGSNNIYSFAGTRLGGTSPSVEHILLPGLAGQVDFTQYGSGTFADPAVDYLAGLKASDGQVTEVAWSAVTDSVNVYPGGGLFSPINYWQGDNFTGVPTTGILPDADQFGQGGLIFQEHDVTIIGESTTGINDWNPATTPKWIFQGGDLYWNNASGTNKIHFTETSIALIGVSGLTKYTTGSASASFGAGLTGFGYRLSTTKQAFLVGDLNEGAFWWSTQGKHFMTDPNNIGEDLPDTNYVTNWTVTIDTSDGNINMSRRIADDALNDLTIDADGGVFLDVASAVGGGILNVENEGGLVAVNGVLLDAGDLTFTSSGDAGDFIVLDAGLSQLRVTSNSLSAVNALIWDNGAVAYTLGNDSNEDFQLLFDGVQALQITDNGNRNVDFFSGVTGSMTFNVSGFTSTILKLSELDASQNWDFQASSTNLLIGPTGFDEHIRFQDVANVNVFDFDTDTGDFTATNPSDATESIFFNPTGGNLRVSEGSPEFQIWETDRTDVMKWKMTVAGDQFYIEPETSLANSQSSNHILNFRDFENSIASRYFLKRNNINVEWYDTLQVLGMEWRTNKDASEKGLVLAGNNDLVIGVDVNVDNHAPLYIFRDQSAGFLEAARIQNGDAGVDGTSGTFLGFSNNTASTDDNAKAGIAFVQEATNFRGDLVFSVDGTADANNVDVLADEKFRIKHTGEVISKGYLAANSDATPTRPLEIHDDGASASIFAIDVNTASTYTGLITMDDNGWDFSTSSISRPISMTIGGNTPFYAVATGSGRIGILTDSPNKSLSIGDIGLGNAFMDFEVNTPSSGYNVTFIADGTDLTIGTSSVNRQIVLAPGATDVLSLDDTEITALVDLELDADLLDKGGSTGTTGQHLTSLGGSDAGIDWVDFTQVKSFTLELPTSAEDIPIWFADKAITVTQINDVVDGTTPSLTYNIEYASTRNGATTKLWTVDRVTTSESGAETSTFDNASIPAGSWIIFTSSAQSGTTTFFSTTILYNE